MTHVLLRSGSACGSGAEFGTAQSTSMLLNSSCISFETDSIGLWCLLSLNVDCKAVLTLILTGWEAGAYSQHLGQSVTPLKKHWTQQTDGFKLLKLKLK